MQIFNQLLAINLPKQQAAVCFSMGPTESWQESLDQSVLAESHQLKRSLLISFEEETKKLNGNIECIDWEEFLKQRWNNTII